MEEWKENEDDDEEEEEEEKEGREILDPSKSIH